MCRLQRFVLEIIQPLVSSRFLPVNNGRPADTHSARTATALRLFGHFERRRNGNAPGTHTAWCAPHQCDAGILAEQKAIYSTFIVKFSAFHRQVGTRGCGDLCFFFCFFYRRPTEEKLCAILISSSGPRGYCPSFIACGVIPPC